MTSKTNSIPARDGPQLFNVTEDPLERHNLAEQHPEKVEQMMQIYRDYVVRNQVIEVPADYRAWEQVKKNGREQFIANHRLSLLLFGLAVIALVVLGGWLLVRRQRR